MAPPSRTFLKGVTTAVFYDENFRFLRQAPSTSVPWGTIDWELWLHSQSMVSAKRAQTCASTGKLMRSLCMPWGFCFTYHRGGDCMGSSFRHDCFKCKGSHRALHCNFRAKIGRIQSQNRGATKPPTHSTTLGPAQQLSTPVNIRCMLPFLSGYDNSIVQLFESGFTSGFPLHFDGPRCVQEAPNLLSSLQNPKAVSGKLSRELDAHRLVGLFSSPQLNSFKSGRSTII